MPYATNGGVSRADMSGDPTWIEIDEDQYAQALAGMAAGKLVSIGGGFAVVNPPEPETQPEPEPQPKTIFAPRDYLKRFTMVEYAAARTGPIEVQWALDNLIGAQFVDVNDPDVAAGLDVMLAAGVIDATRKAELLQPDPAT